MDAGGSSVLVPPGFRFYPTEEELLSFYLKNKIKSSKTHEIDLVIPQLNLYDFDPWDLPQYAGMACIGDPEQWFFFVPKQEKEAHGGRPCRLTSSGFWKATGSPAVVYARNQAIGLKRTMVFYIGRGFTAKKTQWKMNDYKVFKEDAASSKANPKPNSKLTEELSVCRVYIKSKCVRSFDRRPLEDQATSKSKLPTQQMPYIEDHEKSISHFNNLSIDGRENKQFIICQR